MSTLIAKPANYLFRLLKVYSTLALLGAVASIVVQLVIAKPFVLLAGFLFVSFAATVILLRNRIRTRF